MSKHAPAPWAWGRHESHGNDKEVNESLIDAAGEEVCWFGNSTRYDERSGYEPEPADKALIAAAPDLLEACELHIAALRSQIRDGKQRPEYAELIYKAQKKMMAAIAKARGEA